MPRRNNKRLIILCITTILLSSSVVHCQSTTATATTTTSSSSAAAAEPTANTVTFAAQSKKATASCGINGNTDTICSPKAGDTWKNGTWYPITWNPLYPTYVSSSMLDIYIYFVQNYQNLLIKKISGVNTSKGTVPILVDDTWRLAPTAETYDSFVYIVANGVNQEKELNNRYSDYPPPVHNLVAQAAIIPPSPTALLPSNITSSSMASNTATMMNNAPTNQIPITPPPQQPQTPPNLSNLAANKQDSSSQQHNTIQPGIIAAIVLACLAILGACLAVIWVMRHSGRRKLGYGEKGHLELNSTASSSMFPMNHVDSREKPHQHNNNSSVSIKNPSAIHNYSNFSASADPPTLLTAPKGTAARTAERGSLTAQTTPVTNKQFAFMSVPSLPLLDDSTVEDGVYGSNNLTTESFSNISSRSEPPLTSTDALLIADTFRQRMRRPDWQDENTKRRQLSEELLKTELEAEGTLMKKVGKRAHLLPATYQKDDVSPSSSSS